MRKKKYFNQYDAKFNDLRIIASQSLNKVWFLTEKYETAKRVDLSLCRNCELECLEGYCDRAEKKVEAAAKELAEALKEADAAVKVVNNYWEDHKDDLDATKDWGALEVEALDFVGFALNNMGQD